MVIGTDVGGIAEIDAGPFFLGHGLDFWVFLLEPLLHQSLVAFERAMQWLLAGDAELRQETPHGIGAQLYAKLVLDEFGHHLAGPQCEFELQLQWVLLGHHVVNPLQLLAVQLRRPSEQRLRLQRSPAAAPVIREPAVDRRAPDAKYTRYHFGAFAFLYALHCALAQRFQSRMIQLAGIIFTHTIENHARFTLSTKMFSYLWTN